MNGPEATCYDPFLLYWGQVAFILLFTCLDSTDSSIVLFFFKSDAPPMKTDVTTFCMQLENQLER